MSRSCKITGEFLFSIISDDSSIRNTLEVGCAYGLSSLHICSALQDRPGVSHTIIDPFQNTQWDGVGIQSLEAAGMDFFTLIETQSELALPRLLETNEGQFDFIFIETDGTPLIIPFWIAFMQHACFESVGCLPLMMHILSLSAGLLIT